MKKIIVSLILAVSVFTASAQFFEGRIVYMNSYKSNLPNVPDSQFRSIMGSTQEYFIKNGNYKSVMNGSLVQWQLYNSKENKLYTKMANSATILWNDGGVNTDEILKTEVNRGVTEILGLLCDELIMTCKSGRQVYYFSSKLKVNTELFMQHKFGNWYAYLLKTNALPLKSVTINPQFILESVAIEVQPMQLQDAFFDMPVNSKTVKSPY